MNHMVDVIVFVLQGVIVFIGVGLGLGLAIGIGSSVAIWIIKKLDKASA